MRFKTIQCVGLMLCEFALASACQAHFLWVKTTESNGKPQGLVYFGESPAVETYHFPEKMAKTKLYLRTGNGKRTEIATKKIETDTRVGMIGPLPDGTANTLEASQQYGIYGSALLIYHAKTISGETVKAINSAGSSKEFMLEIVPHLHGKEVQITVLWQGKPLADAEVTIFNGEKEPVDLKTGENGEVVLGSKMRGLIGVLASKLEKDKSGKLDGKDYQGVMHYASLTFNVPAKEQEPAVNKSCSGKSSQKPPKRASRLIQSKFFRPDLPEAIASFGAAVADGWLYVYGGHTGTEHDHALANLSKHFRRLKLDGGQQWEELPMQTQLQGLPLVARAGRIYRVGGLNFHNKTTDQKEDMHSVAEFAEFDPATKEWKTLTPLPAARSSHNAILVNDRLYLVGGWKLAGQAPGTWQTDVLVYDFANPKTGWQKLPAPEFKRRALAASFWHGKLCTLGGMKENAKPTVSVDFFDPQSGSYSQGPKLPGGEMNGFGASAWNVGGELYSCGLSGFLYQLNDSGSKWQKVGKLKTPRFFHQLVPCSDTSLLAVGGTSEDGHLVTIEQFNLPVARSHDKTSP